MFDPKVLDELTEKVVAMIPKGIRDVQHDLEKNVRALLQSGIAKMDLVSREEFDIQSAVLSRTREKLEQLQLQVEELEKHLGITTGNNPGSQSN